MKKDLVFVTIHRVLLSLIFLVAGVGHLLNPDGIVKRLSTLPLAPWLEGFAPLSIHVYLSGIALILGGLGLFMGFKTRLSSILLILVLIPITITVQLQGPETVGPLFKNIAILGGLIYFAYFGTRGWSLDQVLSKKSALFALSLFLLPLASEAQTVDNLVVLIKKEQHLKVAIKTMAEGKKAVEGLTIKHGVIIACGKEISPLLKKGTKLEHEFTQAKKNDIEIVACGISLNQAKIDPKELHQNVRLVSNGLRELIRLKAQGYMGIDL